MTEYSEIEDVEELAKLDRTLSKKIRRSLKHVKLKTIGYPQGKFKKTTHFKASAGNNVFWWAKGTKPGFNFLGHAAPLEKDSLNIEVQFNISIPKFSRRRGGCFLKEHRTGAIILAHRGIVTLGHSRIKRDELFAEIDVTILEASTSNGPRECLFMGRLASSTLITELEEFSTELRRAVKAVKERASSVGKRKKSSPASRDQIPGLTDYFEEFSGKSKVKGRRGVVADCYHGKIVHALHVALSKQGKTSKNKLIDLVAILKRKAFLFEVKPSVGSQSIYAGIGQLAVHAPNVADIVRKPLQKVLVVPAQLPSRIYDEVLKDLDVRILTFKRASNGHVSFQNLEKIVT